MITEKMQKMAGVEPTINEGMGTIPKEVKNDYVDAIANLYSVFSNLEYHAEQDYLPGSIRRVTIAKTIKKTDSLLKQIDKLVTKEIINYRAK